MNWFRLYHGVLRDSKIELLADTAKVPRYLAAAGWIGVLQYASEKEDRGSVAGIKARWLAVEVGCTEDEALRLLRGMVTEGLLTRDSDSNDARVVSWEKRQPADPTAGERMARMRRRRKELAGVTRNGDGSDGVTPVTRRNALRQNRADKNREDSPLEPPSDEGGAKGRGRRLPEGYGPDLSYATGMGLSAHEARTEADKFADHWRAKPGAAGRKLDWDATWRNWVRNAAERRKADRPRPQAGPAGGGGVRFKDGYVLQIDRFRLADLNREVVAEVERMGLNRHSPEGSAEVGKRVFARLEAMRHAH